MSKRLHLTDGERDWTAEVTGDVVTLAGEDQPFAVSVEEPTRITVDAPGLHVTGVAAVSHEVVWVGIDGDVFEFRISDVARRARSPTRDHDAFTPPMPATVARILVKPGDAVQNGDTLIALEAMKMELPIRAPRDGVVRAIHCREGELVQPGTILVEMDE